MGEWTTHAQDWRHAPDVHCDLCGRLLPGRHWSVEIDARQLRLCDLDCEEVYREYRAPSAVSGR